MAVSSNSPFLGFRVDELWEGRLDLEVWGPSTGTSHSGAEEAPFPGTSSWATSGPATAPSLGTEAAQAPRDVCTQPRSSGLERNTIARYF